MQGGEGERAGAKLTSPAKTRPPKKLDDSPAIKRAKTETKTPVLKSVAEPEEEPAESVNLAGSLARELQIMMFGFGDDSNPLPETVDLVEDIVLEYTTRLLGRAVDSAAARGRVKPGSKSSVPVAIGPEDILFLVRKDSKKFARVRELLVMQEEIKKAKSIVDVSPEEMAKLVG
ncbi:hypothetical protein ACKKBG_A14940 [Auxenochlorella protothecoides x Auxenochlorella symbiontica]|uniref:Transcription initiation factor TFIID subunit 13 n=1 Tax=Auxenochlorella protothecoides TaxID=3075 RepID=A0A1D2A2G3_AUXPR